MQKEQFEEAHKFFKRAIELSPEDPLILMQYGVLVMEEGRFYDAQKILQDAYILDETIAELVFYLAEVHAHMNLLLMAKSYAEDYLRMDANGPFVDEAQEIIDYVEQNEWVLEEEEEEEVFFLQEEARQHMQDGDFSKAVHLLENIITDYPEHWAAYNNLALAYFYLGRSEDAHTILHDVLEHNKGNLHALCNLAVFYYYERKEEELEKLIELLLKLKPYSSEQRYKLGATFALVGKHVAAFKLFQQLHKNGFEGDAGFYFWYAHSAYFAGYESIGKKAYKKLLAIDETKEGYEPWRNVKKDVHLDAVEQDRSFLLKKIQNTYHSERMLGLFLLGKSAHRQEILSHPSYIVLDQLSDEERLFLSVVLKEELYIEEAFELAYIQALETTEILYEQHCPLNTEIAHLFQMWFTLCEEAMDAGYHFRNPKALAAAADYMFQSARYDQVTKTSIAKKYGISTPTLTKYVKELMMFLPYQNDNK